MNLGCTICEQARSKVIEMKVAHFKCILVDVLQKSQTTEIMAIFLAAMVSEWVNAQTSCKMKKTNLQCTSGQDYFYLFFHDEKQINMYIPK